MKNLNYEKRLNSLEKLSEKAKNVLDYICFEYNTACKYSLNADYYYFSNQKNIEKQTKLSKKDVELGLKELSDKHLFSFIANPLKTKAEWFIVDKITISIHKSFLNNYDEFSVKNVLQDYAILPPIYDFDKNIKQIKKFVEEHSEIKMPTIVYTLTQAYINVFEDIDNTNFFDIPNIWQKIENYLNSSDFKSNEFHYCIDNICKNYIEKRI